MNFLTVWKRIKAETTIKNVSQLAKIVGKTQQTVSAKKGQGKEFPIEWAYHVSKKYDLSLDWILTGEGEKKQNCTGIRNNGLILKEIIDLQEWLLEISKEEPERRIWFKMELLDKFPAFKEWLNAETNK